MSYTIKDNTDEVLSALEKAIKRGLVAIGKKVESYAKKELSKPKKHADGTVHPNVDTGFLRNSITYAIAGKEAHIKQYTDKKKIKTGTYRGTIGNENEDAVYIGTNVEYALYVEVGGSDSAPYSYFKPAVTEHIDEYKNLFKNSIKNA